MAPSIAVSSPSSRGLGGSGDGSSAALQDPLQSIHTSESSSSSPSRNGIASSSSYTVKSASQSTPRATRTIPLSRDDSDSTFSTSIGAEDRSNPYDDPGMESEEDIGVNGYQPTWATHASTEHLNPEQGGVETKKTYVDRYGPSLNGGQSHESAPKNRVSIAAGSKLSREHSEEAEGDEAKQVQQNLERWAAAERQRRKAARTTNRSSYLAPEEASGPVGLARRLTLGRKQSAGNTSSSNQGAQSNGHALLRKASAANSVSSVESGFSSEAGQQMGAGMGDFSSRQNGSSLRHSTVAAGRGIQMIDTALSNDFGGAASPAGSDSSSVARDRKGKGRAYDSAPDPWSPLSASAQRQAASEAHSSVGNGSGRSSPVERRTSVKPTATRPIVTPGRDPSVRRTSANTPSIIAIDADGNPVHKNSRSKRLSAADNPFLSTSEQQQQQLQLQQEVASQNGGFPMKATVRSHDTIPEVEDDGSTVGGGSKKTSLRRRDTSDTIQQRHTLTTSGDANRASMSSSKFREIGLNDDDQDEDEDNLDPEEVERRRRLRNSIIEDGEMSGDGGYHSPSSPTSFRSASTRYGSAPHHSDMIRGSRSQREREAEEDRRVIGEGRGRQPWWTEWLCGCGRVVDDDNEQTGKTGPE